MIHMVYWKRLIPENPPVIWPIATIVGIMTYIAFLTQPFAKNLNLKKSTWRTDSHLNLAKSLSGIKENVRCFITRYIDANPWKVNRGLASTWRVIKQRVIYYSIKRRNYLTLAVKQLSIVRLYFHPKSVCQICFERKLSCFLCFQVFCDTCSRCKEQDEHLVECRSLFLFYSGICRSR